MKYQKNDLVVVLDLDETLFHTTFQELSHPCRHVVANEWLYVRPGAVDFVKKALKTFTVCVWTSASFDYAKHALDCLGFSLSNFACVLTNTNVTKTSFDIYSHHIGIQQYRSLKDLKKISKKTKTSLKHIIAIDDNPSFYTRQYGNLVKIPAYLGNEDNFSFDKLYDYLVFLSKQENVRTIEKRNWQK